MTSIRLSSSGFEAHIRRLRGSSDEFELIVDGTPQSHVNLADPAHLEFDYVRRMGWLVDLADPPARPITVLHLGAGALTLARYIEACRPGSRQQVIEAEPELVALVRRQLPWDRRMALRLRYGDARAVLGRLPRGLVHAIDLIVVDIFSGARTPAHVTSREFYSLLSELLSENGRLLVNIADGGALRYARGQIATVMSLWPHLAAIADAAVWKGRRFGNLVVIAARQPLPIPELVRRAAGDPGGASVLAGATLTDFTAGADIVSDATATPSPPPARSIFLDRR